MLISLIVFFVLSVAAGSGIGGGGLAVVYMTLVLDFNQLTSQCTNLLLFIISALSSFAVQFKNHSLPSIKTVLFCSFSAIPGVFLGTWLRGMLDTSLLRLFFGIVLVLTGLSVLPRCVRKIMFDFQKSKKT